MNILTSLIGVSEKAGNIARICRQDRHLLSLLVQEKKETEKNPRYLHDFKTLADVLVQEVVKYEMGNKFPELIGHICGEESNEFELIDETIRVEVKMTVDETSQLLSRVLPDSHSSRCLAEVVHADAKEIDLNIEVPELPPSLGIWIDPIDSTAEYISGKDGEQTGTIRNGLPCVTVLLGVFDRISGEPIIGVINQPFYKIEQEKWQGRYVFGLCYSDYKMCQPEFKLNVREKLIAVSSSERDDIKERLSENGYTIVEIAGAGYKLLNIIIGHVYGYVLSKPTTYMWDICAGHAILRSIGGDVIDFTTLKPLRYRETVGTKDSCNVGGIIAYRDASIKENIIEILGLESSD